MKPSAPLPHHFVTRLGYGLGLALLLGQLAGLRCEAAGTVVAWGANDTSQATVPPGTTNVLAVAGGASHSVALKADGTVSAWGYNISGQASVPPSLSAVAAIGAGASYSMALQSNGTIVVWGSLSAPPPSASNVVAIAAGWGHALALRSDATIVSWGNQTTVPDGLTNVIAIAAGNGQSMALLSDHTVVAWGDNSYNKTNVPSGLTNVISIAAGGDHCLALRRDGTVVAWGRNDDGQATVPSGLANVVSISGGALHSLALKSDGTMAAWGDNTYGQSTVSPTDAGYITIAAGGYHNLAVKGDGTPFIVQQPASQSVLISKSATMQVVAVGTQPLTYQWMHYGTNLAGATRSTLSLNNVQAKDGGPYTVGVANTFGSVLSGTAVLNAVGGIPIIVVPPQDFTTICGQGATFSVSVGGSTPFSYQWNFQGNPLAGATRSSLVLTNVDLNNVGTYTVVITNAYGSASSSANLVVNVQTPTITSPLTNSSGIQGSPFTYTITALYSPSSFGAIFLPSGLSLNPTNGLISGIPTESGQFAVAISAYNACSADFETLTLNIGSALPVITSSTTASGTEGQFFLYSIRANGSPFGYGVDNLPAGLLLDPNTGLISGVPAYAGNFNATIYATNQWGVGAANLQLAFSYAAINNLTIQDVTYSYSSPYLLDFMFTLTTAADPNNTNTSVGVVVDPRLLSVSCLEDGVPISPSETAPFIASQSGQGGASKLVKIQLVLDYSASIASLANGDVNTNGVSDAIDAMVEGSENFVDQQAADTQIGVWEFHRDDMFPVYVVTNTTDKVKINTAISGIWTNIVQGFSSGSRVWDATAAAIKAIGVSNRDEQHYIVLISDGRDDSSLATLTDVISAATNAAVKVFCVGFGNELDMTNLQTLAGQTGGEFFPATNAVDIASQLAQVAKATKAQYILRWATLNRTTNSFMPSFTITYQGITATSPDNPVSSTVVTNQDTNTPPNITVSTNFSTNFIIAPYYPGSNAGPVTVGFLRLVPNADVQPTGVDLRAVYIPHYIRQLRLHYRPNWPCTVTPETNQPGQLLYGWTFTQTSDGTNGFWILLSSTNVNDTTTSLPFAGFGRLLTFAFQDVISSNTAFAFFNVDNSVYSNIFAGGQSFTNQNTASFTTSYPALPYGTPVPWLIANGLVTGGNYTNAEVADKDGDGALNWQEYWANTDPNNALSKFVVRSAVRQPDGRFQITFSTALNRTYKVVASTDLVTWQTVQDNITGVGQDVSIVDTRYLPNLTTIYYKVLVY